MLFGGLDSSFFPRPRPFAFPLPRPFGFGLAFGSGGVFAGLSWSMRSPVDDRGLRDGTDALAAGVAGRASAG